MRSAWSPEQPLAWNAGQTHCRVRYTESRQPALPDPPAPAYHRWQLPSGEDWITFHRAGADYLLCFPELAHFCLRDAGRHVHCDGAGDVEAATLRHLFLNSVLPMAANLQRGTVLHGGAVQVEGRAIAFVGSTGRGKSTLTAAFAGRGHAFLSDDALHVGVNGAGQAMVAPGEPQLRLWQDSEAALVQGAAAPVDGTSKFRVPANVQLPHCDQELPLAALYFLGEPGTATAFDPVRPAAALLELIQHAFLLDPDAPELLQAQHDTLSALVRTTPVFRLHHPRRYDALPQVCDAIAAHARMHS